jgi:hypothetical protein
MTEADIALARLLVDTYGAPPGVSVETVARRLANVPLQPSPTSTDHRLRIGETQE